MKNSKKVIALDMIYFILGSCIYAGSVNIFTAPNNIAPGGVTGISILFNYLFDTPIGIMIIVINIPLFILGTKDMGKKFLIKTITATTLIAIFIDISTLFLPHFSGDTMLAAIYGGVFSGVGLSMIFLRGGSTGGTDIIARMVNKKASYISMGRIILGLDIITISTAAIVYQDFDSALFAIISIFTSTRIIDSFLYGAGNGKIIYIVSNQNILISQEILDKMKRGVTILNATGAYSGENKQVLLCVVRRHEVTKLNTIVKSIDPTAFIIISEAGEILGEGFTKQNDY